MKVRNMSQQDPFRKKDELAKKIEKKTGISEIRRSHETYSVVFDMLASD